VSAAVTGPYDSMWQAAHPLRALDPRWQSAPIWRGRRPHDGWARPRLAAVGRALIERACGTAGVRLGAFDTEVVYWLAHQEPEICAVVAGLIERAAQGPPRAEGAR